MNLELDEILTLIDKVKETELDTFEYQDEDVKLKIKGKQQDNISVPNSLMEQTAEKKSVMKKDKTIEKKTKVKEKSVEKEVEKPVNEADSLYIEAPLVGTFYHAPAEGAEPFVKVGSQVKKGQVIGIIEAMKLMNEIQSEMDGIVEEVMVPNETLVEFGQKLIRVRPE